MRRAVLDLRSPRHIWSAPPRALDAVGAAFGAGWDVVTVRSPAVSDGDGAATSAEAQAAAAGAEVYVGWGVPAGVARSAGASLRWAHTAAAGAGGSVTPEFRATRAILTNSRGIYADPIADWVVAAIGFCLRGFHVAVSAARQQRWAKDVYTSGTVSVREFADARAGLVGLGGIGEAVARRCLALGMTVRAVRRRPDRPAPAGVQWVGGPRDIVALARDSDVLVIAAPRTDQTEEIVNDEVLDALPSHAFVLNVGRGALLDEAALLRHLDAGSIAGCVLDVCAEEPLPEGHPLWHHARVFLTPHVSGVSDRFWERETALLTENIDRYLNGRPLRNVVDLEAGY